MPLDRLQGDVVQLTARRNFQPIGTVPRNGKSARLGRVEPPQSCHEALVAAVGHLVLALAGQDLFGKLVGIIVAVGRIEVDPRACQFRMLRRDDTTQSPYRRLSQRQR